ncbi:PorV/PorQ family protein [candidate division WOR-3 bacterium]|nr:PorV/PorQ family protein [candidate division WOR-3 bacterium]
MKKLLPLLLLLLSSRLWAGASEAGAIFLIIYPGARPNGMAATFTATSDDALATYYNDAGLGFQDKNDIALMHANWLPGLYPGMYYEFLTFSYPTSEAGVIGGHIIYLTTGETVGTDWDGTEIGKWTTWDASLKISYGVKMNEKLALGFGAKFVYSFLAPADVVWQILKRKGGGTGTSWAFDVSTLYILNKYLQFGLSLQNLGPNIKYTETGVADPLPWTLRTGLSWCPINTKINKLTLSTEFTKILVGLLEELKDIQNPDTRKQGFTYLYQDIWKAIGIEYVWSDLLSLRGGFFWDTIGSRVGPTFGGGVKFKGLRFDIGVDSNLYDFKTSNYRLSLNYSY